MKTPFRWLGFVSQGCSAYSLSTGGAAAHTAPGDSRQDPSCAGGSALPSASFSPLTGGQRSGQARRAPVLVAVGTGRTSPPLAATEAQCSSLRYSETAPRGRALEAELSQLVTRCCWRASPRELSDTQVTETQLLAELWVKGAGVAHRRVLAVEEGGV